MENKVLVQTLEAGSFQKFGNHLQYYHLIWAKCLHPDPFFFSPVARLFVH